MREQRDSTPLGITVLPYVRKVTDRIGKLLQKYNIKTIFKPTKKIKEHLRTAKDTRDPLATAGVYRIPCSCGKVYIGTTKRSIKTRLTEHKRCCRLGHIEKSAIAEHTLLQHNHRIQFEDTQVLSTEKAYHARMYREALEIQKHTNNFNRKEESLTINKAWLPALKNYRTMP